jgi:hypothetical protein
MKEPIAIALRFIGGWLLAIATAAFFLLPWLTN